MHGVRISSLTAEDSVLRALTGGLPRLRISCAHWRFTPSSDFLKILKKMSFLLKASTQPPKIGSLVLKFENPPTYCDFEIHNIDPQLHLIFMKNSELFIHIKI